MAKKLKAEINNNNNMYKLSLTLDIREELLNKWCEIKGYTKTIKSMDATGQYVETENVETEVEFFERLVKNEIINLAINPIQNAIITEANLYAQKQSNELKEIAENSLKVEITQ